MQIPYNRLLRKNGQVLTAHEAVDIDPAAKRVILADNTFVK
jgi:NADH dehydrogenase FAD-containing subunit